MFQGLDTWMSDHDIGAGSRWGVELSSELESSNFGILCLTPENTKAPWVLFEAGALAKIVKVARVVPYRLHLRATDVEMPLAQFQGVDADEAGTFRLVQGISEVLEASLQEARLRRLFDKWWPDLESKLDDIPLPSEDHTPRRSQQEMLEEVLQLLRSRQMELATVDPAILHGLRISSDRLSSTSDADLIRDLRKLTDTFVGASGNAEKHLLSREINKIRKEVEDRLGRLEELERTQNVMQREPQQPREGHLQEKIGEEAARR
jgi:hypothetical protein